MKLVIFACIAAAALVLFTACGSSSIVPDSSISIYRVSPEVPLSTPGQRGSITLHVGDDYQILVKRLTNDGGGTHTSDVTTVCVYRFSQDGFATANTLGVIHAVAVGFTTLEAKLQPGALDPIDRCYLDITIVP